MDGEKLLDWELVHGADTQSTDSITSKSSSVIDDGMILSHHFSADKPGTYQSLESGDSPPVDYGSNRMQNRVDFSFDQLNVYQAGVRNELGLIDGEIYGDGEGRVNNFEDTDDKSVEVEVGAHVEDASKCLYDLKVAEVRHVESQSGVKESVDDSSKSLSESGGDELVSGDSGIVNGEDDIVFDSQVVGESGGNTVHVVSVDSSAVRSGDEGKSRETVVWKMPFVLVKYYAFRIGPVWSVSMAAALMGFLLLGRRLYTMKKKAQRFHLKVTIDNKKVSGMISQAARLNEAFTEVRRVPVIRPALPSPGAWPVLSLR